MEGARNRITPIAIEEVDAPVHQSKFMQSNVAAWTDHQPRGHNFTPADSTSIAQPGVRASLLRGLSSLRTRALSVETPVIRLSSTAYSSSDSGGEEGSRHVVPSVRPLGSPPPADQSLRNERTMPADAAPAQSQPERGNVDTRQSHSQPAIATGQNPSMTSVPHETTNGLFGTYPEQAAAAIPGAANDLVLLPGSSPIPVVDHHSTAQDGAVEQEKQGAPHPGHSQLAEPVCLGAAIQRAVQERRSSVPEDGPSLLYCAESSCFFLEVEEEHDHSTGVVLERGVPAPSRPLSSSSRRLQEEGQESFFGEQQPPRLDSDTLRRRLNKLDKMAFLEPTDTSLPHDRESHHRFHSIMAAGGHRSPQNQEGAVLRKPPRRHSSWCGRLLMLTYTGLFDLQERRWFPCKVARAVCSMLPPGLLSKMACCCPCRQRVQERGFSSHGLGSHQPASIVGRRYQVEGTSSSTGGGAAAWSAVPGAAAGRSCGASVAERPSDSLNPQEIIMPEETARRRVGVSADPDSRFEKFLNVEGDIHDLIAGCRARAKRTATHHSLPSAAREESEFCDFWSGGVWRGELIRGTPGPALRWWGRLCMPFVRLFFQAMGKRSMICHVNRNNMKFKWLMWCNAWSGQPHLAAIFDILPTFANSAALDEQRSSVTFAQQEQDDDGGGGTVAAFSSGGMATRMERTTPQPPSRSQRPILARQDDVVVDFSSSDDVLGGPGSGEEHQGGSPSRRAGGGSVWCDADDLDAAEVLAVLDNCVHGDALLFPWLDSSVPITGHIIDTLLKGLRAGRVLLCPSDKMSFSCLMVAADKVAFLHCQKEGGAENESNDASDGRETPAAERARMQIHCVDAKTGEQVVSVMWTFQKVVPLDCTEMQEITASL